MIVSWINGSLPAAMIWIWVDEWMKQRAVRIVLAGKLGGDFSAGSNLPRGIERNVNYNHTRQRGRHSTGTRTSTKHDHVEVATRSTNRTNDHVEVIRHVAATTAYDLRPRGGVMPHQEYIIELKADVL